MKIKEIKIKNKKGRYFIIVEGIQTKFNIK